MDKFVPIPNYLNYGASKEGEIINLKKGRILKPFKNRDGYLLVKLTGKTLSLHRLIAKVFVPNLNNKPEVNHIDGNKENTYKEVI